jgi:limonene 1,2-monooxygenase
VAETREQARADVKFGLDDFNRYFNEVATFPIIPPDITGDPADYLVSSGLACIGTPDDCIRHFERLWKGSDASAPSCCWRTTGPTGGRRSAPTS